MAIFNFPFAQPTFSLPNFFRDLLSIPQTTHPLLITSDYLYTSYNLVCLLQCRAVPVVEEILQRKLLTVLGLAAYIRHAVSVW